MANKKILLGLMVGLLAMSFVLPATAVGKPAYALGKDAIPGWTLWKEGAPTLPWNFTIAWNLNVWYQFWMNNQTNEGWASATAAMLILLMEFPSNIDLNAKILGIEIYWPFIEDALTAGGANVTVKTIAGYDHALIFQVGAVWGGLGNAGNTVVLVVGVGSDVPPENVFELGVKTPTDSGATYGNIMTAMAVQGGAFGGIPGFTLVPIFIGMVLVLSIMYLIRKNQLTLLK